jgi:hypothetical protein
MLIKTSSLSMQDEGGCSIRQIGKGDDDRNGLKAVEEGADMPTSHHDEIIVVQSPAGRRRRKVYRGAPSRKLDWSGIAKVAFVATAAIAAFYFVLVM